MKYEKSSKRLEPQNNCMDRESFEETTHDFFSYQSCPAQIVDVI